MAFDRKAFEGKFNAGIKVLAKGENEVRAQLNVLSRTVLEAVHATENIGYVNKLIEVLTPINRKAAVVFFKHFAGFHYDDATHAFTKKSKKRYDQAQKDTLAFLEDPNNNLFSWANRHVQVEQKPFDPLLFKQKARKTFQRTLQEARDHGLSQSELFLELFKGEDGQPAVDMAAIIGVLDALVPPKEPATTASVAEKAGVKPVKVAKPKANKKNEPALM